MQLVSDKASQHTGIEPTAGLSEAEAKFYTAQLLGCLSWIHQQGLAHRDIKPGTQHWYTVDVSGSIFHCTLSLAL